MLEFVPLNRISAKFRIVDKNFSADFPNDDKMRLVPVFDLSDSRKLFFSDEIEAFDSIGNALNANVLQGTAY